MIGTVYGLLDPRTDMLRYVGATFGPTEKRFVGHLRGPSIEKVRDWPVYRWIGQLQRSGLRPTLVVLDRDEMSQEDLDTTETTWIVECRALGCRLTNVKSGGSGAPHSVGVTVRERISNSLKGRPKSEETKARMSANCSMKRPEVARRNGEVRRGMKMSPEAIRKNSESHLGKPWSEERWRRHKEKYPSRYPGGN